MKERLNKIKLFSDQYLKNVWVFTGFGILMLIIIIINIINFTGGVKVSSDRFYKSLSGMDTSKVVVESVSVKIGFKLFFVAKDIIIKSDDFEVKIEQLILKKSFFGNNTTELNLINGVAVLIAEQNQTIQSALSKLKKIFLPSTSAKQKKILQVQNLSLTVEKKSSKIAMSIENFNGSLVLINDVFDMQGTFLFNKDIYTISSLSSNRSDDFNIKIEGENIIFKTFLEKARGKVLFSINNITHFLNIITPDTINFDLGGFDGSKNSLYFESDITYNDVRKSTEFSNSKLQIFGGAEETILIENINNNAYKVDINIDAIKIVKTNKSNNLIIPNSAVPNLQFGSIFPEFGVAFNINLQNLILIEDSKEDVISNLKLEGKLGYNNIDFISSFAINNKIFLGIKGFLYNYETSFRKGLFQFNITGDKVDLTNVNIFNTVRYNGKKESDFTSSFDFIIMGDTGILDNLIFNNEDISIRAGKLETNLYLRRRNYFLNLDIEKLNLSSIKLITPEILKTPQSDFFRILFEYLKPKNISNLNIKCDECKIGEQDYNAIFEANIAAGRFEVKKLQVFNKDFGFNGGFIFDIRNLRNNLTNFDINFDKWNDFKFEHLINISNFIESFSEWKLPSFENFSGSININFKNIKGKLNTLDDLAIKLRLIAGEIKENYSSITFNGVTKENFFTFSTDLNTSSPFFSFTSYVPNINIESILKATFDDENYDRVSGFMDVAIGGKTRGFLFTDLLKNLNVNIALQSGNVKIKDFNLEALSQFLSNPNSIFKDITNKGVQNKIIGVESFQLQSKIQFQNMEFNIESLEVKSISSSTVFVGKLNLLQESDAGFILQLVGKSAIAGANLNTKLQGFMPLYISTAISNTGKVITIQFDYSQIDKYSEARRVLYK